MTIGKELAMLGVSVLELRRQAAQRCCEQLVTRIREASARKEALHPNEVQEHIHLSAMRQALQSALELVETSRDSADCAGLNVFNELLKLQLQADDAHDDCVRQFQRLQACRNAGLSLGFLAAQRIVQDQFQPARLRGT